MFARQLCRRIPGVPELRPVALRPTLSGGLPSSGRGSFRSLLNYCKAAAVDGPAQMVESNGHHELV